MNNSPSQRSAERLYKLLPSIYQLQDVKQGEPLRALLAIIESEFQAIEADIEGLYDNWFIETCEPWVVPYIGDLLKVRDLYADDTLTYGPEQRAHVANTLAYRRRKGTAPVLEQLAQDITGWRARAVEFFQLLATTQNLNHLRTNTSVDLRSNKQPELLGTPFEQRAAYTAEIRRVANAQGKYNVGNMGLFLWRLRSYPIERGTARAVKGHKAKINGLYYTFNPLGREAVPLFNQPQTETEITQLAEEINVPGKLFRHLLQASIGTDSASKIFPRIFVDGQANPISPEEILVYSLGQEDSQQWQLPPQNLYLQTDGTPIKKVALDPELGRLAFLTGTPRQVEVSYSYGFSSDVGSGPYDRSESLAKALHGSGSRLIWSVQQFSPTGHTSHTKHVKRKPLAEAVRAWNKLAQIWQFCQDQIYIPLAQISVDANGKISHLDTTRRRLAKSARGIYQPGIVKGLDVNPAESGFAQIQISPGKAINRRRRTLKLENRYLLDLSPYTGQTVTVFIALISSRGQSPIRVVQEVETGVITVEDNHTYRGNLTLKIPAGRQVKLLAANQCRPHIRGNLSVIGLGIADETVTSGRLTLNGLLIEGRLTVQPGDLKSLQVSHCTLVPEAGGLIVEKSKLAPEPEAEEDVSFLALLMYGLSLISNILRWGASVNNTPPKQNLGKLVELGLQQTVRVFATVQAVLRSWQSSDFQDPDSESEDPQETEADCPGQCSDTSDTSEVDNSQLEIALERSICGPIHLADTVPSLWIADSIIDKGCDNENGAAIIATGTAATIRTTTVFGSSHIRSLEASSSIFSEKVTAIRRQVGCLRFCYVVDNSHTPRRYRCQPDLALSEAFSEPDSLPSAMTSLVVCDTDLSYLFAATAGDGIFRSTDNGEQWQPFNNGLTNLHITALLAYHTTIGSNTVANGAENDADNNTDNKAYILAGTAGGGIFYAVAESELNWIAVDTNIKIGTDNDTDAGLDAKLNTDITALAVYPQPDTSALILAATAGNGIFSFSVNSSLENGNSLQQLNRGLTNHHVTALAVHPNGQIFAGTTGGIFRTDRSHNWVASNRGLTSSHVTALLISASGQIFAGTSTGLFHSADRGEHWQVLNLPATTEITALLNSIKYGQGTINSTGTTVRGIGTAFKQELKMGDALAVAGQIRIVTHIDSDELLTINSAFKPDLPAGTTFTIESLWAGTAGQGIFYSTDNGNHWIAATTDLASTDVAALAIKVSHSINTTSDTQSNAQSNTPSGHRQIFAATAVGGILRSGNENSSWTSINRGLKNVDEKLLILARLQPSFTWTCYSDPGYAQLASSCPPKIRTGAEDSSEMGVFNDLKQPQREANLRASLEEYLRFGLEAGIFYIT
ncbi:hypothetical protein [Leptolyngbya sp. FACHB-261]|uniref:hypothetical protein n=1 Tax=Leptolyngbya sp. FACHB-261 TaxID=2692806 RepID=UPI00168849B9|nr:hypothetical protein [Leptolyngbya sp. FACHB-261]MBD2099869.1 hypothetical protein [Leptolyngbya sp. FACHB-261]